MKEMLLVILTVAGGLGTFLLGMKHLTNCQVDVVSTDKQLADGLTQLFYDAGAEYVEKKQGLSYLSWAYAWAQFKKFYPDATYEVKKDANRVILHSLRH